MGMTNITRNVKYSMLFDTYRSSSKTLRLDEVGSSLLASDVTDEHFNPYWLVYILFTNRFEIIPIAIASLDEPNTIILHCGTNNLRSNETEVQISQAILNKAKSITSRL